jgi:hypothetical protein
MPSAPKTTTRNTKAKAERALEAEAIAECEVRLVQAEEQLLRTLQIVSLLEERGHGGSIWMTFAQLNLKAHGDAYVDATSKLDQVAESFL